MARTETVVDDDPLTLALAPPPNETEAQREARLKAETEARRVSDRIDEQLKAERAALRRKKPVKVLLLGQSESGACNIGVRAKQSNLRPSLQASPRR